MKKLILLSLAITLVVSCSQRVITVALPLPPPLVVPTLDATALECLADDTYQVLVQRDKLKSARIETLENIIRTTHE